MASIWLNEGNAGKGMARIAGFACLFGFLSSVLPLAIPLSRDIAWRTHLFQQIGDRGLVLLFGMGLLIYSFWRKPSLRQSLSYAAMVVGLLFLLTNIWIVADSQTLKSQAMNQIAQQVDQVETQIQQSQLKGAGGARISEEKLQETLTVIDGRAETLRRQANLSITKGSVTKVLDFLTIAIGLLSLGRLGSRQT
jgi:hypothetical protein